MASFNKVVLLGNLVKDPELRYSPSNIAVARTTIASNRKYKEREETLFIDIVIFGKQAEIFNSYATKGVQLLIEGRLIQNKWEEDGKNRYKHEIIVDTFQLLGSKKENRTHDSFPLQDVRNTSQNDFEEDDDDIPF